MKLSIILVMLSFTDFFHHIYTFALYFLLFKTNLGFLSHIWLHFTYFLVLRTFTNSCHLSVAFISTLFLCILSFLQGTLQQLEYKDDHNCHAFYFLLTLPCEIALLLLKNYKFVIREGLGRKCISSLAMYRIRWWWLLLMSSVVARELSYWHLHNLMCLLLSWYLGDQQSALFLASHSAHEQRKADFMSRE